MGTEEKVERTPGPWVISGNSSAYMQGTIISRGNKEVAGVWEGADAAFIVKAENHFDDLVAALKQIRDDKDSCGDDCAERMRGVSLNALAKLEEKQ